MTLGRWKRLQVGRCGRESLFWGCGAHQKLFAELKKAVFRARKTVVHVPKGVRRAPNAVRRARKPSGERRTLSASAESHPASAKRCPASAESHRRAPKPSAERRRPFGTSRFSIHIDSCPAKGPLKQNSKPMRLVLNSNFSWLLRGKEAGQGRDSKHYAASQRYYFGSRSHQYCLSSFSERATAGLACRRQKARRFSSQT